MRLPWFNGSHSARKSMRRRRRSAANLRVRQLERRRVLDAAMQSLVVTSAVASDVTAASVAADVKPSGSDWSPQSAEPAAADTNEAAPAASENGDLVSPVGSPDETPTNVRPVLVVALDQIVGEGQLLDLSGVDAPPLGLFIDDGGPDSHTVTVNWGDSLDVEQLDYFFADGSGAIVGTHTYALEGVYEVSVAVEDSGGLSDTRSFFVTVENTPPVLTVALDQTVHEGSVLNLSGVGAPPLGLIADDGKSDTHTATVDWGDGTVEPGTVLQGMGSAAIVGSHTYLEDGVYEVKVQAFDNDGDASQTRSFFVTVKNTPPVLTVAFDQIVDEGAVLDLSGMGAPPLGLIADDGKLDTHTATVDWGDGTIEAATVLQGMGSAAIVGTHTYLDDGVYEVKVRALDDDGAASQTKSFFVAVKNVPPVLTVALDHIVDEGAVLDLSGMGAPPLGLVADDGHLDTHNATVDWGDGTVEAATVLQGMGSAALVGAHVYADNGVYEVKVRAEDDDGGVSQTKSFFVTVKNVAPSLANIDDVTVDEGSPFTLVGLNVRLSDPGFDHPAFSMGSGTQETFAVHSIDWGDGTPDTSSVMVTGREPGSVGVPTTAQLSHAAHTYADNGDYTVTLRVADDDMGAFADPSRFTEGVAGEDFVDLTFTIQVDNVRPMLSVVPTAMTINESQGVSFTAEFTDPGFDNPLNPNANNRQESFTYSIDWDDGRQPMDAASVADMNGSVGVPSSGMFGGAHVYADDGVYEVKVTIRDDDGGEHVQTIVVTVQNINPSFVPTPQGASFQGIDVTSEGTTTLRVAFTDPGFDNPANPNAAMPPSITDPTRETFTHVLNWGDGTIDAVHTYAESGIVNIGVTQIGPDGGMQIFNFPNADSSQRPVLTLVSSQAINDPAVPAQSYTYLIHWGDGVEQTVPLMLKAPGIPVLNSGLTSVLGLQRASGSETTLTTGSLQVQHRYLGPPNPLNPTADIRIAVAVVDDNNGSVSDFILVDNPGIQTPGVAIDTTPAVPPLELAPPPPIEVFIDQTVAAAQSQQSTSARVVAGDLTVASERYLLLEVIAPDGKVVSRHRIHDEALNDVRAFFATLPDNHYRIYLVQSETNSRRLIMDVVVRNGRVIDPSDDTEGTRDRPPTAEQLPQTEAMPLEENPLLEPLRPEPADAPVDEAPTVDLRVHDGAPPPLADDSDPPVHNTARIDEKPAVVLLPLKPSPRWVVPLAGLALAASGASWSKHVHEALENATQRDWQRLRRAGRSGRTGSNPNPRQPPPADSYNGR